MTLVGAKHWRLIGSMVPSLGHNDLLQQIPTNGALLGHPIKEKTSMHYWLVIKTLPSNKMAHSLTLCREAPSWSSGWSALYPRH